MYQNDKYEIVPIDFTLNIIFLCIKNLQPFKPVHIISEVSTKFLPNYMRWYKWFQSFNNDKKVIKPKNMLIHSAISFVDTKIEGYKNRKPNFEQYL